MLIVRSSNLTVPDAPSYVVALVERDDVARLSLGGVEFEVPLPYRAPAVPPDPEPLPDPPSVALGVSALSGDVGDVVTLTATWTDGTPDYTTRFFQNGVQLGPETTQADPALHVAELVAGSNLFLAEGDDGVDLPASSATVDVPGLVPEPGTNPANLAALLAIDDLEVGQSATLGGRLADGDGGGGAFVLYDGGAVPDDGLCFAPDSQVSDEVTETWTFNSGTTYNLAVPSGQNVVQGSYHIDLLNGAGELLLHLPGALLHGHRSQSRLSLERRVDVFNNQIRDTHQLFQYFFTRELGDPRAGQVRITYRHTTGPLRWVRQGVTDTLNARWFGARTHTEDTTFNNQPVLCHMVNVARLRNAVVPGQIRNLLFPNVEGASTVYEYFGSVSMVRGGTLRGTAGTELVDATTTIVNPDHGLPDGTTIVHDDLSFEVSADTITIHYRPVRERTDATFLRVKSGEALRHVYMSRARGAAGYQAEDAYQVLDHRWTGIYGEPNASDFHLADIVLDGNEAGNASFMQYGGLTSGEKESYLRESPSWSGFVSTNHGNVPIPVGQQITLNRVAVIGYGATGILGHINNEWTGHTCLFGDSIYNHNVYACNGPWTHFTMRGFGWTHHVMQWGVFTNYVYERGAETPAYGNPHNYAPDLVNWRAWDAFDTGRNADGRLTRTDGTIPPLVNEINGWFFDFRGARPTNPFNGIGYGIEQRNGVCISGAFGFSSLFNRNANENANGLYPDNLHSNTTLFLTGTSAERLYGPAYITRSAVRDVTVVPATFGVTPSVGALLKVTGLDYANSDWENPKQFLMEHQDLTRVACTYVADVNIWTSATRATEVYLDGVHVRNTSNTLFRGPAGTGVFSTLNKPEAHLLKFFLRDSSFRLTGSSYQDTEIFFKLAYLQACVDAASGRTSEDAGVYVTPSAGAVHVIPTALLWQPHATDGVATVTPSTGTVLSKTWTDASGAALGSNKRGPYLRVEMVASVPAGTVLTWSAAVRPWPVGVAIPGGLPI